MTCNLKALRLTLIAVFAISALAAASASAKYDSEIAKTYIHGQQITNHVLTTNAGTVTCKKVTLTGVQEGTSNGTSYTVTTIKVTPSYSECTAFGFPANVKTNECQYELLAPTALAAGSKILCPAGKQIEIIAVGFCTMTMGAQTPGGTVSFTNEGVGTIRHVKFTFSLNQLTVGGGCGSGTNGATTGTHTVRGYSNEGLTSQVGIWVTN